MVVINLFVGLQSPGKHRKGRSLFHGGLGREREGGGWYIYKYLQLYEFHVRIFYMFAAFFLGYVFPHLHHFLAEL